MQFLKTLIDNIKTKEKTGNITEKDLKELKDKIDNISNTGLDWEVKNSVENPIIANDFWLEEWHENIPFYLDDNWVIKIAVNNWPDIDMIKIIEWETDWQKLVDLMNKRYVDVKKLMDISTPDVKNLVWMLYEIVVDPKKLLLYREELQGQLWYKDEIKKHGLDESIS